jgi:hypothetical protein
MMKKWRMACSEGWGGLKNVVGVDDGFPRRCQRMAGVGGGFGLTSPAASEMQNDRGKINGRCGRRRRCSRDIERRHGPSVPDGIRRQCLSDWRNSGYRLASLAALCKRGKGRAGRGE